MQYVRTDIEGLNIIVDSTEDAHRVMRLHARIRHLQDALAFMVGGSAFLVFVILILAWKVCQ